MEKKSFGARLLALVTSVATSILLIVLGVLRAPLVILEELTDEQGPLLSPTKRKVTKQDFNSPQEFLSFLKVRLREVWKDRIGGLLVVLLGAVLRIFKEPVDTLHDFYENIDDPNYDPMDMQSVSSKFWSRVKSVWRRRTLVGRKVYAYRLRRRARTQEQEADMNTTTSEQEQGEVVSTSFSPENLSHPGWVGLRKKGFGPGLPGLFLCVNFLVNCQTEFNEVEHLFCKKEGSWVV